MLITISKNNNVLCKAMPLDVVLKSIGEEIEHLEEDGEMDLHIWKEVE